jgi:glycerol-3-phosphate dehydrogenase (NAD(P)+)
MSTAASPSQPLPPCAVIGSGSWGTALADVLAQRGPVRLWTRDAEVARGVNERHQNPKYQARFVLSDQLTATTSLEEALEGVALVALVVPSHVMGATAERAGALLEAARAARRAQGGELTLVSASKGIEGSSLHTMEEVLRAALPPTLHERLSFLSGPSFAQETLEKQATAVTVAARAPEVARAAQERFSTAYFRLYTSDDVMGVELGGALKNVIAIASGVADGLGLGHNARAALITRGVAEISRLAVQMGANPLTLAGLAGMGDLILTCTGGLSRNRFVGVELGKGRSLDEILSGMAEVAEGVKTAYSAHMLARREGVDMPITAEVYAMLYEGKSPRLVLRDLMGRDPRHERDPAPPTAPAPTPEQRGPKP